MRNIEYTNKFKKSYTKLDISLKNKVKETIGDLRYNPFLNKLKVHKLSWKLFPYYSCSIDYKNRVTIYQKYKSSSGLMKLKNKLCPGLKIKSSQEKNYN